MDTLESADTCSFPEPRVLARAAVRTRILASDATLGLGCQNVDSNLSRNPQREAAATQFKLFSTLCGSNGAITGAGREGWGELTMDCWKRMMLNEAAGPQCLPEMRT